MEEADGNSTKTSNWSRWFRSSQEPVYEQLNSDKKSRKIPSPILIFGVFFVAMLAGVVLLPKSSSPKRPSFFNATSKTIESFTRDVTPKQIHSHNDYWRKEPFFTAYKNGAISIEADVWYFPETLHIDTVIETTLTPDEVYVGHTLHFLKQSNTLTSMYLVPIFDLLYEANRKESFLNGTKVTLPGEPEFNGIYYNDPFQQLYFWLDIKTYPEETYEQLKPLFQDLIDNDWLTYYDVEKKKVVNRPLVVTLTGNLPTEVVKKEKKRYFFLDGPLSQFKKNGNNDKLKEHSELSMVASGSLESLLGLEEYQIAKTKPLSTEQLETIKEFIDTAHNYRLKTRLWGGILWPHKLRKEHDTQLLEIGLDFVNTDYVEETAQTF